MKSFVLFIFLFFCATIFSFGQYTKIDSLLRVRSLLRERDSTWVNTTNTIAEELLKGKSELYAIGTANEAYRVAQYINYDVGKADALMVIAGVYYKDPLKRDKECIDNYNKALEIYEKSGNQLKVAQALKTIGDYYYKLFYLKDENHQMALDFYLRYVVVTEKSGNKIKMAEAYINLGNIYDELGDEKKSNDFFLKAVRLKEEIEDEDLDDPHLFSRAKRFYELQIANNRLFIYGLFGGLLFTVIVIFLMYLNITQRRKSHNILSKQKDEILQQKNAIEQQANEIKQNAEEIASQRDQLQEQYEITRKAQKAAEDANNQLTQMVEHLEELVEARTQDLRVANDALTIANEELDILIYRASHDFKGPVATLQGLALLGKMETKVSDKTHEFFIKIEEVADKMDGMLEKLHQVSYLLGKKLDYKPIYFDTILEDVKYKLNDLIIPNQIHFDIQLPISVDFFSDPELIFIILENLIENAINFRSHKTDITPLIHIQIQNEFDHIILEVNDNGAGIAPEYFPKIFDMFFRGSEMSKGNGLGLYVVKKALERLKAEVEIRSEIDKFTTFSILFPK